MVRRVFLGHREVVLVVFVIVFFCPGVYVDKTYIKNLCFNAKCQFLAPPD